MLAPGVSPPKATPRPMLVPLGCAAAAAALALLLAGSDLAGVPAEELTPDPNSVSDEPGYVGVLSTLGIMLWGAMAAACLLTGLILRGSGDSAGSRFMLATAALLTVLGVDDAAMIHEDIGPGFLNVPQVAWLGSYLALTLAWVIAFRSQLRSGATLLLGGALCFAIALAVDFVDASRVVEDYFKYVGMFAVAGWALLETRRRLLDPVTR